MKLYFIPILVSKDKEFVYPFDYLTERAETGIKNLLSGFEILKTVWDNGILQIQAELDIRGKIAIIENDNKINIQIDNYLSNCFKNTKYGSPYLYRNQRYRLTLIYLSTEI